MQPRRRAESTLALTVRVIVLVAAISLYRPAAVAQEAQSKPAEAIAWDQIGAKAGADYKGDGLSVTPTALGVRLHCVFQRLEGEATTEGLWLVSTVTDQASDRFRVMASAVSRVGSPRPAATTNPGAHDVTRPTLLPASGRVTFEGRTVRFSRPGLVEEYTVSMDGVRQDFVVLERPPNSQLSTINSSSGELRVELAVSGAAVEQTAQGAQLVLEKSGRKIAYSRLKATDAKGKELPARIKVVPDSAFRTPHSAIAMAVLVDDTDAAYPIRIDPTFSDANWVSMGGIPGASADVRAAVVDGSGNLYIGGDFTIVGDVIANCVAKWNGSSWSALGSGVTSPPNHGSGVYALAVSGSDLYMGGWFTTAGGVSATNIAKWNGSSWSALGSGVSSTVVALAVSGDDLYAGGFFTIAGDSDANYIAKWNGSSWSALGLGMNYYVYGLAVSSNGVYAGGGFSTAGENEANYIAKWDGNSWSALGAGMNGDVHALALSGSDLYAGGAFTWAGNSEVNHIAKWDGSSWSAIGSGIDGSVKALVVSGSNVYAGGEFTMAGGSAADYIAKWDGSNWSALGSGMNFTVNALAVLGDDLYAGGGFWTAGESDATCVAKWDGSGWSVLGAGMGGDFVHVNAVAVSYGDVYVGGTFTTAGGSTANYIAKWDGGNWSALGSGMNGQVQALAVSGSDVYAGGEFTTADGMSATNIAKWDGNSWSALGSGISAPAGDPYYGGNVLALAVSGSGLYAGGYFTMAGGVEANSIAKWNGSNWSALGTGIGSVDFPSVLALAVIGSDVYAGGDFTTAGGVSATNIAKWSGSSWSALGSGMNGDVWALAVSGSDLYAGGLFTTTGGSAANYIAKWDGGSWSVLGSGMDSWVFALAASGSDLYAGGVFTTAGGTPAKFIAKWNGSSWNALGSGMNGDVLGSGMNGDVYALALSGNDLYAGGWFTTAGGKVSTYVAKWAPLAFRAGSVVVSNGTFQALLTGPDANSVVVDASSDLTNWIPTVTNTLPPGGAWPMSLPLGPDPQQFYRARLGP